MSRRAIKCGTGRLWSAWLIATSISICSGCAPGLGAPLGCESFFGGCDGGDTPLPDVCRQDSDCAPYQVCVLPDLVAFSDASISSMLDAGMDASRPVADSAVGDAEAPLPEAGLGDFTAVPSDLGDQVDVTVGRCECRSDRCGEQRACDVEGPDGFCVSVECQRDSDCGGSGFECHAQSCWDIVGKCDAPESCRVPSTVRERFEPLCLGSRCQLQADAVHRRIPNLSVPKPVRSEASPLGSVVMRAPAGWTVWLRPSELSLEWTRPAEGSWSLLVLVNRPATSVVDIQRGARWAAFVPDSACERDWCVATWYDGLQSVDEALQALVPDNADGESSDARVVPSTYYLVALHMREQDIVATSAYVPVRIGSSWPSPGDRCDASADAIEACSSPRVPMTCAKQRCRVLCASHTDCKNYVRNGALCGPPDSADQRLCPL